MIETYYRITPNNLGRISENDIGQVAIFHYVAFITATRENAKPQFVGGNSINYLDIVMQSPLDAATIQTLETCVNVKKLARKPR